MVLWLKFKSYFNPNSIRSYKIVQIVFLRTILAWTLGNITHNVNIFCMVLWLKFKSYFNPNSIRSYKIVQKLSPKHAARGIAQSPYPTYRHGKACLSKQPPWRAAGDPRLARGRSRVRAPGPAGALRTLFFSTLPSFLLREIVFFAPSPPNLWNLWLG